jgi:6-phosphogluconolactonase
MGDRAIGKSNPEIVIYPNRGTMSVGVSSHVVLLAAQAIAKRKRFYVALSGGSLLEILSPPLVAEPLRDEIDWSAWHIFWADERCVPPTSLESNYRVANQQLFRHINIPFDQIYALDSRLGALEAAEAYEATLNKVFQPGAGRPPRFDLILLGIGEDGHIASLFPNHPLLNETQRWVAPIFDAPKPPPVRVTLTLPVINNARHIVFVAAGAGKKAILSEILGPGLHRRKLPVALVKPNHGDLRWFVDVDSIAAADRGTPKERFRTPGIRLSKKVP